MPSGGGSAGGGGGGGGGGGFGGGSHWSTRGYSFRRKTTYGSSGSRGDSSECGVVAWLQCLLVCGLVVVVALVIGLSVGFGVRNENMPKSMIATEFYSPGDSRLISFSSFFCSSVHFSVKSQATGASFFLVDSAPPLTDQNNFTIKANSTLDRNNYHFWQYHLYPNSKVMIDVCTDCSRVFLDIYVIKGNTNVNRWGDEPGENHAQLFHSVSTVCPDKQALTYSVVEEDEYYIIVHNSFDKIELYYDLTLTVERFEYESPPTDVNSTINDHCIVASGENCAVDIPYSTGSQQALVITTIPENVDWTENVGVKTSCSRRHWAYAVVVLVPLFVLVVGIVVAVLVIWRCCCVTSNTNERVDKTNNIDQVDNIDTPAVQCTDFVTSRDDKIDNADNIDTPAVHFDSSNADKIDT